jgi:hypothetical protein
MKIDFDKGFMVHLCGKIVELVLSHASEFVMRVFQPLCKKVFVFAAESNLRTEKNSSAGFQFRVAPTIL